MANDVRPIEDRRLFGIGLVILGYMMFAIIDTCAKWLSQAGLPTSEVVFVRYAGQLFIVSALLLPTRGRQLIRTRNLKLEIIRGLFLLASTAANFIAILFLPLTITGAILFTTPFILTALSIPLLGEQVGWRRWVAIGVGFVGILVIVRPGSEAFHPAVLLSLACALFTALYMVTTRKLAGVDGVSTQQFYSGLVATTCLVPFVVARGWVWPSDPASWFAFVMIGTAALAGHQFLTTAYRYAPASVLAPFGYVQILFLTGSSWLVFNQPPDAWFFIGLPIVVGSGLYIWLRERQLSKAATAVATRD